MELQIRGVSKTYPNGVQALKDVTLTIPAGMYGLAGPNGAGKSTLMRMIATLQDPDSGAITLGPSIGSGQAIDVVRQKEEVRKTLGYTGTLSRMVASIRASLDYYTRQFGPYPWSHLTLIESPALRMEVRTEAATV
jgi:ABC-2 type transport system ATP-binding protein